MEPIITLQEVWPGGFNKQVILTIRRFGIKDITSVFLAGLRPTLWGFCLHLLLVEIPVADLYGTGLGVSVLDLIFCPGLLTLIFFLSLIALCFLNGLALRSTRSLRERRMGMLALVMVSFFACLFLLPTFWE